MTFGGMFKSDGQNRHNMPAMMVVVEAL